MPADFLPKGVHAVNYTRKDGTVRTYYYAWRGGPAIMAPYGTSAFMAELEAVLAPPVEEPTIRDMIASFKAAPEFTGKAAKTQSEYARYLAMIEAKFGKVRLRALAEPRARGQFKDWRDTMAATPRKADYAWSVLARLMSFGKDRGKIPMNPCERGGKLYKADRADKTWEESHLLRLFEVASPEVTAVVTMALWTGQRQSDCLAMKWSDLEVGRIRVKQSKGSRRVMIPLGEHLAELVAGLPRVADTILTNSRGKTWTADGFKTSFGRTFERAGIVDDLHFHDLRGTAVTRMALAGCNKFQIAAVTGHSERNIEAILEAHYLGGRAELAEQAIRQLESGKSVPNLAKTATR